MWLLNLPAFSIKNIQMYMKFEDIKSVIRTGEGQTMKWTKDEKKEVGYKQWSTKHYTEN